MQKQLAKIVKLALIEDKALFDVTSNLTITKNNLINFAINSRQDITFCGKNIILEVFAQLRKSAKFKNSKLDLKILKQDGVLVKKNQAIATGYGDSKLIFAAERVILNLIQHLSGITTLTNEFCQALGDNKIKILDTRKTIPNLRFLQKYAVKTGGGSNHRFDLSDLILIKDNHIAAADGIANAINLAKKNNKNLKIEVECDNLDQVKQATDLKADIIMLDNMTISQVKEAIKIINNKAKIEISGGINLTNIKNYRNLKIDFISIGCLTHSIEAVDIGLDIIKS